MEYNIVVEELSQTHWFNSCWYDSGNDAWERPWCPRRSLNEASSTTD